MIVKQLLKKSVTLISVLCLLGFGASSQLYAKTLQLTYSNFFPPTQIHSKLAESWCREVEKRTNGEVKISYFPGQTLTKSTQTYESVSKGLADIGFSILQYTRGRFPLMDFINLPLGYPTGPVNTAIINEVYDKFKPKELDDVEVMYLHAHGPGIIHSKSKPLHTMDDLKGLKFRSHGPTAETVKLLGGTPIALPMPELYQALQKGVVQGGVWDISASYDWKLAEVAEYTTAAYSVAYSLGFFVVMNKAKWAMISPASQKAIRQINQEWTIKHGLAWERSSIKAVDFTLNHGNTIIGLGPEESKKWRAAVQPVIDEYIQDTASKGLPGKEVIEYVEKRIKDANQEKFTSKYMED